MCSEVSLDSASCKSCFCQAPGVQRRRYFRIYGGGGGGNLRFELAALSAAARPTGKGNQLQCQLHALRESVCIIR